jgi:acyl-CoA thioesterase II
MSFRLDALLALLDLEELEVNIFRGTSRDIGSGRVFGGQVLAQALVAAGRTVEAGRVAHSLHSYFILPGDLAVPIVYFVERLRDGKSFTTRRVTAIQHGRAIFEMSASFHGVEEGLEHQAEMPEVLPPEEVTPDLERARATAERLPERVRAAYAAERPFDVRSVEPGDPRRPEKRPPRRCVWFRAAGEVPSDDALRHQSLMAYMSDYGLLATAFLPHALTFGMPGLQAATLDHAIWFHRPFRADDWLLYATDSPSASGARGFARGSIFARDGRLVASVAQEGLMRRHAAPPAGA